MFNKDRIQNFFKKGRGAVTRGQASLVNGDSGGAQNHSEKGKNALSLKDSVANLDLSLEPELDEAAGKMCNFETVLETLSKDVAKFKEMVQDVCFQTTVLSEAFRTVFARSEDNDNIVEHHRRSMQMANSVRGHFELDLEKKVAKPLKRQRSANGQILREVLEWHDALKAFIKEQQQSDGSDEVGQRLEELDLKARARDITNKLASAYSKRFKFLHRVFSHFQYIQKRWFLNSGNALLNDSTRPKLGASGAGNNIHITEAKYFPSYVFAFIALDEILLNTMFVCRNFSQRALHGHIFGTNVCGEVKPRLLCLLGNSDSVQVAAQQSWAVSVPPVANLRRDFSNRLASALSPSGGTQEHGTLPFSCVYIAQAYDKLTEKLEEEGTENPPDDRLSENALAPPPELPRSATIGPELHHVFDMIERDVQRTYGKEGKRVLVHADEDNAAGQRRQSANVDDVEKLVSVALGVSENHGEGGDDQESPSWASAPATHMRRATCDDGLVQEDVALVAAKTKLRRILRAYAMLDRRVSYCQGMNFIARSLLKIAGDVEPLAFLLLVSLFQNYGFCLLMNINDMRRVQLCFFQLDSLIKVHLPLLSQHFAQEGVSSQMYASSWFMTLFSKNDVLPPRLSTIVVQGFFWHGWPLLFQVAIAILSSLERMLLAREFEGIVQCLQNSQSKIGKSFLTPESLFEKALSFRITAKKLRRLEEIFERQESESNRSRRQRRTNSLS